MDDEKIQLLDRSRYYMSNNEVPLLRKSYFIISAPENSDGLLAQFFPKQLMCLDQDRCIRLKVDYFTNLRLSE